MDVVVNYRQISVLEYGKSFLREVLKAASDIFGLYGL